LWPFLWIWAMAYRPERGWGFGTTDKEDAAVIHGRVDQLLKRVAELEAERQQRGPKGPRAVPAAATIESAAPASGAAPVEPTPASPEPKRRSG
jgi:hypothetical protein